MESRQEYLKYLLGRKQLTEPEEEWLLAYLENEDMLDMETVAAAAFNEDIAFIKAMLNREQSEIVLTKIYTRIEAEKRPKR